jgi:hypothetical protein
MVLQIAAAQVVLFLRQHHDGAALRRLVGQRGKLRRIGQFRFCNPGAGTKREAWRLPNVMVPVLSSSSVLTSPAASTARPDMASTLCCTSLSMPAIPIAESSPPIVVGIRQTSSDTSTNTVCGAPE